MIFFRRILFLGLLLGIQIAFAQQPWMEPLKGKPTPTFYEIQDAFNTYWKNRPIVKGAGYKSFKRWEYFWKSRVNPVTGEFPDMSIYIQELQKIQQRNQANMALAATWTEMGPKKVSGSLTGIGRVNVVKIHPTNTSKIYAGTAGGGLWISNDAGSTWATSTDQLGSIGISDIVFDPTNSNTMYMATGDADGHLGGGNNAIYSVGLLKSTDGGNTWAATGFSYTYQNQRVIYKIHIHKTNNQIILLATNNGLYRSSNGGTSFSALYSSGIFTDIKDHPTTPNTIYTTAYGNGVYVSTNGGTSFTQATGLPSSDVGRIQLATTAAAANNVYAIIAKNSNSGLLGVYRSTNSGTSFSTITTSPNLLANDVAGSAADGQGFYDLAITVDPTNANIIYVGGVNIWKTTNGGSSWTLIAHWSASGGKPYVHADQHCFEWNGTTLYIGNDGSIWKTTNGGTSYTDLGQSSATAGIGCLQIYRIGNSTTSNSRVLAGAQDNGTNLYNNAASPPWSETTGGDGMECFFDRTTANTYYTSVYNGSIYRTSGMGTVDISPNATGAWVTPFVHDPNNNTTIYGGYQDVWKTTNSTATSPTWAKISNNLTGGDDILALAVAPSNSSVIYAAESNAIYKTTNGGTSWSSVTSGLPVSSAIINYIAISNTDPNVVFVVFGGFSSGNKVFKSTNGGSTWTNYSTGLLNVPVNCIVYQNSSNDAVYVGTDFGVYYRDNSLSSWVSYNTGLPNVIVDDLEIQYSVGKLRAGTFGRGLWESDLYSTSGTPSAQFTVSPTSGCAPFTITPTNTSTNATSYTWTFSGGTPPSSNSATPTVTYYNPGTYSITLIATGSGGSDTLTRSSYLVVSAKPSVSATANPATISSGGSSNLTATGASTYVWSPATGLSSTTGANVTASPTSTTTYTVIGTAANGCKDTTTVTVTVTGGSTNCSRLSNYTNDDTLAIYTANGGYLAGHNSYQDKAKADKFTLASSYTIGSVTFAVGVAKSNTPASKYVTLKIWDDDGTGGVPGTVLFQQNVTYQTLMADVAANRASIVVLPTPLAVSGAIYVGLEFTYASGDTVALFTNRIGNTPAPGTGWEQQSNGSWYAYSDPSSWGSTVNMSHYIFLNPVFPDANFTASGTTVCAANSVTFTNSSTQATSYSWSFPGGTPATSTATNPTVTYNTAGTYAVTLIAIGACGNDTSTQTNYITVSAKPSVSATANPATISSGGSSNLTATGASSYVWSPATGLSSTTGANVTASPTSTTTYTVIGTAANGCKDTTTVTVTVTGGSTNCSRLSNYTNDDTLAIYTANGGYLAGHNSYQDKAKADKFTLASSYTIGSVTFAVGVAKSNTPASKYVTLKIWDDDGTGGVPGTVLFQQNVTYQTLMADVAANRASIVVLPTPLAVSGAIYVGLEFTYASGDTVALFTNRIGNTPAPGTGWEQQSNGSWYAYSDPSSWGSTVNMSHYIFLNPVFPDANFTASGTTVCAANSVTFTNSSTQATSYSWSFPGGTPATSTATNPTVTYNTAGTYAVTLIAIGACGNDTLTRTSYIIVNSTATPTISGNTALCSGSTLSLTASSGTSGATYSWTGPNGFTATTASISIPNVSTSNAGTYTVVAIANSCTSATATKAVTVNSTATPTISGNTALCSGSTLSLTASSGTSGATYSWTGPNGFTATTASISIPNVST
ncbi:MAG: PKD domain-containing protein, partial [Bacteroidia bacterium]|nr:PKD domain-containing protein [Bacteroidia bacterium]